MIHSKVRSHTPHARTVTGQGILAAKSPQNSRLFTLNCWNCPGTRVPGPQPSEPLAHALSHAGRRRLKMNSKTSRRRTSRPTNSLYLGFVIAQMDSAHLEHKVYMAFCSRPATQRRRTHSIDLHAHVHVSVPLVTQPFSTFLSRALSVRTGLQHDLKTCAPPPQPPTTPTATPAPNRLTHTHELASARTHAVRPERKLNPDIARHHELLLLLHHLARTCAPTPSVPTNSTWNAATPAFRLGRYPWCNSELELARRGHHLLPNKLAAMNVRTRRTRRRHTTHARHTPRRGLIANINHHMKLKATPAHTGTPHGEN
jgi:hypothetical protein